MRKQYVRNTILFLSCLILSLGCMSARAADVLGQLPDGTLGVVVVQNLKQADQAIGRIATEMKLPAVDLLQMAQQRVSLLRGISEDGELAVVLVGQPSGRPYPLVFLPVTDYDQWLSKLNPDSQSDSISRVAVNNNTALVAKKGDFAVLTAPMFQDQLQEYVDSKPGLKIDDQVQSFKRHSQAYVVVTNAGVKLLSQQAIGGLQVLKRNLSQLGTQGQAAVAGLGMYEEMFKWASKEVSQLALALHVADDGSASLKTRFGLVNAASYTPENKEISTASQLNQLPDWPYIAAMAGQMGDSKMLEGWIHLSVNAVRSVYSSEQMTEEQVNELIKASQQSMQGVKGFAFTFGVPKSSGSMYDRMAIIMDVKDANAYITNYLQAVQKMKEIIGDNAKVPFRILNAERTNVAGVPGMKVAMKITPTAFGSSLPQNQEVLNKLFGENGTIEVYAAPVDDKRVALAYSSADNLKQVIASAKAGQKVLGSVPGIKTTTDLLSNKAQWVGYLSLPGMLQYMRAMIGSILPEQQRQKIHQIPDFPACPPLGFSLYHDGQGIETRLVAPAPTLALWANSSSR